ncbi:MAG: hypothetical protein EOP49_50940, partial [Sphingobacteriales bacterium]
MYRIPLFTIALLFISLPLYAGDRLHWGAAGQASAKVALLDRAKDSYSPLGRTGLSAALIWEGIDEQSLMFTARLGIIGDQSRYRIYEGGTFGISRYNAAVHPEVWIPTRFPKLRISAGFALDLKIGSDMFVSNTGDNVNAWTGNFDRIDSVVQR